MIWEPSIRKQRSGAYICTGTDRRDMRAGRTGTGTAIGRSGWDDGLPESINTEHAAQDGRFGIKERREKRWKEWQRRRQ